MHKPTIELNEREFALARVELLEAWKRLESARDDFVDAIRADAALPAWCDGRRGSRAARSAAIATFSDFFYVGDQSPKTVSRQIGLIGASSQSIRMACNLNDAKREFASCLGRLQHCLWIDERRERHPLVSSAFRQIKVARINTLQATRQVVIVQPGLQRVSWCSSLKPRTKQVTREEVIGYINSKPSRLARLAKVLPRIERLAPNTLLARFRPGNPSSIANAVYLDQEGKRDIRQYTSGMPLLIELHPGQALPECIPRWRDDAARKRRPSNIHRLPFVKALKLHRYREQPARARAPLNERPLEQLFRGP